MSKSSLLFALIALACVTGSYAGAMTAFTSITFANNGQGSLVFPVLVFTPATSVTSGATITLTMPAGYFLGTATFASGASSITSLTGTAPAAVAADTTIVITTGGAATTTVAQTVTLSGLRLGAVQNAAATGFNLKSSLDTTDQTTGLNAPAIVVSMGVTAYSQPFTGVGSSVWPVITFTAGASITLGGTITITMPAGYFLGTAAFAVGSIALFSGAATAAATATSTSIVLTTAGAASGTSSAVITLTGLTLGAVQNAGHLIFSSSQTAGTQAVAMAAIVAAPTFTSISWTGNAVGYATDVVLVFTPAVTVGTSGTITLGVPAGYFLGTGTFAAGKCSLATMTGTTTNAATSSTDSIVITISVVATGTAAVTMTLTGLTLGSARAASYFALSTSAETGTQSKAAPAIGSVVTSASITLGSAVTGADPKPVLVFTPVAELAIGDFITITMPAGYFIGTATFAAGAASPPTTMTGSATAVTATSTSIVITTAGAVSGVAALTVTLSGLTLGSVRAVGSASSLALSTSKNIGMVYSVAPAILGGLVAPSIVLSSVVKAVTPVTATVTFTTATVGVISKITVAGVNFGTTITSALTCTGLSVGVASIASTTNLVLTVTTPASIAAATVITCIFAGLTNSATAAAASTVSITTSTADPVNIDRATGVSYPAIFNALLTTPSIVLSSTVKGATGVIATVTFTTVTVGLIAKITVAGVNFGTTITAALTCTGLSVGVASISTTNLVLTVTTPASIATATAITCNFAGLTNSATVAAASTATITTATASAELDGVTVSFPAITADVAAADNKKSSASLYGLSVLLIALPFLFA